MNQINASGLDYRQLNQALRSQTGPVQLSGCMGQRFIAAGMAPAGLEITGVPGNALGAYLSGGSIEVRGNAQDAVGDTMNAGTIAVHGSIGDAAGYAMRGGALYIRGNAGYRAGIHMKAYGDTCPLLIIGGRAGSFLGEYQAGGVILVLGLHQDSRPLVGSFPCAGMHGGRMFLRCDGSGLALPPQVTARPVSPEERQELRGWLAPYCGFFGLELDWLLGSPYTVVTPDTQNPYKQLYVMN